MKVERVRPGEPLSPTLGGAVLTRDLVVGGTRWSKGRRLSAGRLRAAIVLTAGGGTTDQADSASARSLESPGG